MATLFEFQQSSRTAVGNPISRAATSALIYVLFCTAYIVISSRFAANSANDTEELAFIETFKGTLFVAITGIVFFLVSMMRWRHIKRQEEKINHQEQALLISERKSMAAMFAASLSHDLNNLLMTMGALTHELKELDVKNSELNALRENLDKGIASLSHLAKRIVATAKHGIPEAIQSADLRALLTRIVALAAKHPSLVRCKIDTSGIQPFVARINTALLEDAIINLLINAGQAAGPSGRISIRTIDQAGCIRIEVHDNGPGVPSGREEEIFDPCFTTKPDGTGLGLLAVKAFAGSCEGSVSLEKSDLGGAAFAILIPKPASA